MQRWFLSYHSPDQALAERLKAALERKVTDAQVFFAPSSLRGGGFWSKTLADEIARADAFILLVGERGVGNWQVLEYDEALDKRVKSPDFPVILILLEGQTAPGLPFLRRLHWIITADPSSEKDLARLLDAASGDSTRPGELWRYTSPYRGLAAMEEKDSDYFFGREKETVDVLSALAASADRLPVLLGNSGVGKSSLAQAGVLAALKRQVWPEGVDKAPEWPHAFQESRRWCFLTLKPGIEPLKALVEAFLDTWQLGATDPERVKQQNGWIELLRNGKAMLRDLLDATERRYKELDRTKPPAFLLYVDQGEELYVRAEERQRRRFSEVIAQGVADPRVSMLFIRGGFSTDAIFKADRFTLNTSTPDFTGLRLSNYAVAANVNYKSEFVGWWIEPTVGTIVTNTFWDASGLNLGLTNGHQVRVQGGARIGSAADWNGVRVGWVVGLSAYSDVVVSGGVLAVVVGNLLVPTDQNKIFGQATAKLNFDWGRGLSSYVEGEVRGRDNALGVAARLGVTYAFH